MLIVAHPGSWVTIGEPERIREFFHTLSSRVRITASFTHTHKEISVLSASEESHFLNVIKLFTLPVHSLSLHEEVLELVLVSHITIRSSAHWQT